MSSISLDNLSSATATNASTLVQNGTKATDTSEEETKSNGLGMSDVNFLQMLTTQLKYQDPLKPSDNQEFANQMATFTTMQTNNKQLDMLKEIKKGLEAMTSSLSASSASMTNSSTIGMINKKVKIDTERIYVDDNIQDDKNVDINIDISKEDPNAEMVIKDDNGEEIFRRKVSAIMANTSKGEHTYSWDRRGNDGKQVLGGEYGVNFESNGKKIDGMSVVKQDIISGVRFDGDQASVIINGKNYPVTRIIEVL